MRSLDPPPSLPSPFARHAVPRPCLPASDTGAPLLALAVPARHRNSALRSTCFRLRRGTSRVWPVNPNTRLNLVAIHGTRRRPVAQGFEDCGLRLADAVQQHIVQGVPGFEAKRISLSRDNHAAALQFGQNFGCLEVHSRTSPSSSGASKLFRALIPVEGL